MGIKRSDQHSQGGKPQMGYRGGMVPPPRAGTSGGPPHLPLPPPPPPPKQHQIPQHYNRLMPAQHFRLVQQPRSDGGYIHSGGEAPPGIRQAPLTPPQQDKSHSLVKIASHTFALPPNQVRPPPPYAYRGPPPPPAMQPRPPGHHSRPPAMYPGAPGGGQMVYNMAPTLIYATPMSLPPPQYQQPPPRQQFYPATPPAMPPMVPPHHPYFGSFPNRQTQPSFYMPTGGGPGAGVGGGGGGPPTGPPNSIPPIPHQPHQPIIHVGRFHVPTQQPVSIAADKRKRRRHAIAIVDPRSGKDVTEEILDEDSISGESSERQTPQPDVNRRIEKEAIQEVCELAHSEAQEKRHSEPSVDNVAMQNKQLSENSTEPCQIVSSNDQCTFVLNNTKNPLQMAIATYEISQSVKVNEDKPIKISDQLLPVPDDDSITLTISESNPQTVPTKYPEANSKVTEKTFHHSENSEIGFSSETTQVDGCLSVENSQPTDVIASAKEIELHTLADTGADHNAESVAPHNNLTDIILGGDIDKNTSDLSSRETQKHPTDSIKLVDDRVLQSKVKNSLVFENSNVDQPSYLTLPIIETKEIVYSSTALNYSQTNCVNARDNQEMEDPNKEINDTNPSTTDSDISESCKLLNNCDLNDVNLNSNCYPKEENIDAVESTNHKDTVNNNMKSKISYKEGQWSPANLSGKKTYDRDFLTILKDSPLAICKPKDITTIESFNLKIQTDQTDGGPSRMNIRQSDIMLSCYARPRNAPTNRRAPGNHGKVGPKGGSAGPPPGNKANAIHVSLSLREDVKLNETQNAWKPTRMRSVNLEEEELATQEVYKKFRSILNKLTPEKFDVLISQVRDIEINTIQRLEGVINLLFEKAIDEPNFSVQYALMCKELGTIQVQCDNPRAGTFKTLIIVRCQREFEKEDTISAKRQQEIANCTNPEKKKELLLNLAEDERKIRMRSVGNVRFIGELFKQDFITNKIMLHCIERLLSKVEEETLECLCKLLTTIGKTLEKGMDINLQVYFDSMKKIADDKTILTNRVRFMLQDVIDLRKKNWVPRQKAVVNPKTMDQIEMEESKNPQYAPSYFPSMNMPRKDDRPGNMNKRGGSKSVSDEGWSTASSRNTRSKPLDSNKLRNMASTPVKQTSLQPSSSTTSWGRGSNISGKMTSPFGNRPGVGLMNNRKPATETNIYNHLRSDNYVERDNTVPKSDPFRPKGASIAGDRMVSQNNRNSLGRPLSQFEDKVAQKMNDMMNQNHESVYGLLSNIQKTFPKDQYSYDDVVKELFIWGIIRSNESSNMSQIGEVTGRLVDDKELTTAQFLAAIKQTCDTSSEPIINAGPQCWDLLSQFIWGHMKKNSLSLWQIHNTFSKFITAEKGLLLLKALLAPMKSDLTYLSNLWGEATNMELSDWMSPPEVAEFLENSQMEFLKPREQVTCINPSAACLQMLELMNKGSSIEFIKAWIRKNIGEAIEENWFIRALTEAIYTYTLCPASSTMPRFDDEAIARLNTYYKLLIEYVSPKLEYQCQCLFAIQQLMHKLEHPQGIAVRVFEHLWESAEVVTTQAFLTWEESEEEQEGKGVLLKMLTSLFLILKDDSSDGDLDDVSSVVDSDN